MEHKLLSVEMMMLKYLLLIWQRLERLQDANRDLAETLESKLEKISSQETR